MRMKITDNTLLENRHIEIDDASVTLCETAFTGGKDRYRYDQVEYVLLSEDGKLSVQAGARVLSVRFNADKEAHRQFLETLMSRLAPRAAAATEGSVS